MSRRSLLVAAGLTLLASANVTGQTKQQARQAGAPATHSPTRYSPAELHALGEQLIQKEVAAHGRASNDQWTHDVDSVLTLLSRAAGLPGKPMEFVIVNNDDMNAAAVPGGYMIVNTGLITSVTAFANARYPNDAAAARGQYFGFLTAVLGHELAHYTLGHTDSLDDLLPAPKAGDDSPQARLEQAIRDPQLLASRRHSRSQESAADRTGSLYALRAGFQIQHAIDLFKILSDSEKAAGGTTDIREITWIRDHPRASQRAADLEEFRATLMRDQTHFDDALTLINNSVMLDTAIALLDTVLTHFPHLRQAEHARAAALQRKFMRQMSVSDLRVRSAVGTYDANFLGSIRGGMTATARADLDGARRAYRALLVRQPLPLSLANLAVLDAYAGDLRLAAARADSAVQFDSSSVSARLNHGVVAYLAGNSKGALADFEMAQRMIGSPNPIVTFDIARARLALGDSADAYTGFATYAQQDAEGPWHDLAVSLAQKTGKGSVPSAVSVSRATSPAGLDLPVALGTSAAGVRAKLGTPVVGSSPTVWSYPTRGVVIGIDPQAGAIIVSLTSRQAGSVDGVRVGDPTSTAATTWGTPVEAQDNVVYFRRGTLIVAVEDAGGFISSLTVAKPR